MRRILVTGSSGLIGSSFCEALCKDFVIVGVDKESPSKGNCDTFIKGDVTKGNTLKKIYEKNFDCLIHCAAIKDLFCCEKNPKLARNVNVESTKKLYGIANKKSAKFIFLSSDVVFDGVKGQYSTKDSTHPINEYGKNKETCEKFLMNRKNVAICRTALVFGRLNRFQRAQFNKSEENGEITNQSFLLHYIIHKLKENTVVFLPKDTKSNPTYTDLLIKQIRAIIDKDLEGLFHTCGKDALSRFEFGEMIAGTWNLNKELITPTFEESKLRPKDISLKVDETEKKLGFKFPSTKKCLEKLKKEMLID